MTSITSSPAQLRPCFWSLKVRIDLAAAVFSFFLPTLLGNVTGRTVLFAVIAYAQVRDEIDESK